MPGCAKRYSFDSFISKPTARARRARAHGRARARLAWCVCVCASARLERGARSRHAPNPARTARCGCNCRGKAPQRRDIVAVHATDLQIIVLRRVGAQVAAREDVLDVSAAVRVVDQTARHERRIRRRVFHVRGFVVFSSPRPSCASLPVASPWLTGTRARNEVAWCAFRTHG